MSTMAKVELRKGDPARTDVTRGDGYVDESSEPIRVVRAAADQMPADAYALGLRRRVYDGCDAWQRCSGLLRSLASDFERQHAALEGVIQGVRRAAVASVPPNGHSDPSDYQGAVRAAQDAAQRGVLDSVAESLLGSTASQAEKCGADFSAKLQALSDELDGDIADARSPTGLRRGSDSSLERITRLSSIQRGYESRSSPAAEIQAAFVALANAGDDDRVRDLIDAVGPTLGSIRTTSAPRRGPRADSQGGNMYDPGSELSIANRMVDEFDKWQRAKLPTSIRIGLDCLADLAAGFSVCCGTDHRLLSRDAFAQVYLEGNRFAEDAAKPWKRLDHAWTARSIPGLRSSGWVSSGAIARVKGA